MAEYDSAHLQSIEKMRLSAFYQERRMGQFLGFGIALLGIGSSVYLAITNHELTASVLGGTTLVGLVSVFVAGRLSRNHKSSS